MNDAPPIVAALRQALAAHGDPERAVGQQRYMKSAMPHRGITSPQLRAIVRATVAATPLPATRDAWTSAVCRLWDDAAFREERYAATLLAQHRSARGWQDPETLALYRHLVVTGAWWDHVDEVTSHCISPILLQHREAVTPEIRTWARADDLWLRRSAIISQLPFKGRTDTALLSEVIEANVEGTAYGQEFFVRKAIGWALRQHARTDPEWVRAFVAAHERQLSGLSKREALKHLG